MNRELINPVDFGETSHGVRKAALIKDLPKGGRGGGEKEKEKRGKAKPCFRPAKTSHALGAFEERLSRKTRTPSHRRRVDVDIQSQGETSAFINLQRQHALNFVQGTLPMGTIMFCLENHPPPLTSAPTFFFLQRQG